MPPCACGSAARARRRPEGGGSMAGHGAAVTLGMQPHRLPEHPIGRLGVAACMNQLDMCGRLAALHLGYAGRPAARSAVALGCATWHGRPAPCCMVRVPTGCSAKPKACCPAAAPIWDQRCTAGDMHAPAGAHPPIPGHRSCLVRLSAAQRALGAVALPPGASAGLLSRHSRCASCAIGLSIAKTRFGCRGQAPCGGPARPLVLRRPSLGLPGRCMKSQQ